MDNICVISRTLPHIFTVLGASLIASYTDLGSQGCFGLYIIIPCGSYEYDLLNNISNKSAFKWLKHLLCNRTRPTLHIFKKNKLGAVSLFHQIMCTSRLGLIATCHLLSKWLVRDDGVLSFTDLATNFILYLLYINNNAFSIMARLPLDRKVISMIYHVYRMQHFVYWGVASPWH